MAIRDWRTIGIYRFLNKKYAEHLEKWLPRTWAVCIMHVKLRQGESSK